MQHPGAEPRPSRRGKGGPGQQPLPHAESAVRNLHTELNLIDIDDLLAHLADQLDDLRHGMAVDDAVVEEDGVYGASMPMTMERPVIFMVCTAWW